MEKILKMLEQLVASLKLRQEKPPIINPIDQPFTPPVHLGSKITVWAKEIQRQEGWFIGSKSWRNNNPGNLKFSSLTAELGAVGKDSGNFAIFKNYIEGLEALCDFLELACKDKLLNYHNARTLRLFTRVYALPPNDNYAIACAKALGVSVDCDISELI